MNISSREVRCAEIQDIPDIISILEQNLIINKKIQQPDVLGQSGFLINRFSPDDAKNAILEKDNFIFMVSTECAVVIGYAIGCDVKKLNSNFQEELSLVSTEISRIITSEKTLYLRHIAKKANKNQVGKGLLNLLVNHSKQAGYRYIICSIAEKPIQNTVSKKFHEKNDFLCVGFYQVSEKTFGVYLKKII